MVPIKLEKKYWMSQDLTLDIKLFSTFINDLDEEIGKYNIYQTQIRNKIEWVMLYLRGRNIIQMELIDYSKLKAIV